MTDKIKNLLGEEFWLNNPSVLFQKDNWYKVIPTKNMTLNEILNAITRLLIYLTILCLIFTRNIHCIYLFIISILIIIIIYYFQTNKTNNIGKEKFNPVDSKIDPENKGTIPNSSNPFGNLTLDKLNKNSATKNQRQFYKTPSTKIANNKNEFAHWLYQLPTTCKEDSAYCLRYEDVRYSKENPQLSPSSEE